MMYIFYKPIYMLYSLQIQYNLIRIRDNNDSIVNTYTNI